jgi:hypothetical protein
VRLDWTCRRVDAVTLVALRLENDAEEPRRVRVENRLDGPVRPPRSGGRPVAGWGAAGYEGVLDPGETRPLGYACPAPPIDPPAAVEESAASPDANRKREIGTGGDGQSAGEVVAALGDPRPPRDAVPMPDDSAESGTASSSDSDPDPNRNPDSDPGPDPERASASASADTSTAADGGCDVTGSDSRGAGAEPPAPVTDWLDDVAGRIESDALAPGEERALAVVGERIAAVQVALAGRRRR